MPKIFTKIFDSLKIQNVGNFDFEKRAAKITQIFQFLEHSYFLMGDPIDMRDLGVLSKKCSFGTFSII